VSGAVAIVVARFTEDRIIGDVVTKERNRLFAPDPRAIEPRHVGRFEESVDHRIGVRRCAVRRAAQRVPLDQRTTHRVGDEP
jgi:hypothetical protein